MKTVLWISRHEMTDEQFRDLERVMEDEVQLIQWSSTIADAGALRGAYSSLGHIDAVAAVLPLGLLCELRKLAGSTPVLISVSERKATGRITDLPDGRKEPEVAFAHICWEQVLKIEIQTRRL